MLKRIYYLFLVVYIRIKQKNYLKENISIKLGTEYGGWEFIETNNLNNSRMLSCGIGEDISFELEFAQKYNSKIFFVDPTPRAIAHFQSVKANCGKNKLKPYSASGKQDVHSYELGNLKINQIELFAFAISDKEELAKFYSPKNENYVSHSLELNNDTSRPNQYLTVETKRIASLIQLCGGPCQILKLDVEGVASKVLRDFLISKMHFDQILVEFEELRKMTFHSFLEFINLNKELDANGYKLIRLNHKYNFTYLKINKN